jgi:hypothetical protein
MRCRPRGRRAEKSRSQRTEARHHADSWECPVGGGLQDPIRAWERPRWEGARIRFAPEQEGNQIAWLRPSDVWLQWPKSDRPLPSNAETKKKYAETRETNYASSQMVLGPGSDGQFPRTTRCAARFLSFFLARRLLFGQSLVFLREPENRINHLLNF